MKILLTGYYGHRNFGDDLLLKITADHLSDTEGMVQISVTCDSPKQDYIANLVPNVATVEPGSLRNNVFRSFDRVIFGGGGTVFEYRDDLSMTRALRRRIGDWGLYGLARATGTRFATIGLGVGPFANGRAKRMAMNRLRYQDLVYLRDMESLAHVHSLLGSRARIGHDLCFSEFELLENIARTTGQNSSHVVFVMRHYKYGAHGDSYVDAVISAAETMEQEGKHLVFAFYQSGYDEPVIDRLRALGKNVWVWNPDAMSFEESYTLLASAGLVVTARMHAVYLAGMLGVPVVGIELHPKLRLAAQMFGGNSISIPADPTPTQIISAARTVCSAEPEPPSRKLHRARSDVLAMFNALREWAT